MNGWRMTGEHSFGFDAETLEPGDWLVRHRNAIDEPDRWCQVIDAKPTPTDLDPCAMDVIVIWEGESKRTHFRIPARQWTFRWAGKHRPICSHCGGSWPCEQVRMVKQTTREMQEQARRCVVCGKSDGNTITVKRETPSGVVSAVYHTAKSRRQCRAELVRVASERELAWIRQMERR